MPSAITPLSRTARRRCPRPGSSHAVHITSRITLRPFPSGTDATSGGVYEPPRRLHTPALLLAPIHRSALTESSANFSCTIPAKLVSEGDRLLRRLHGSLRSLLPTYDRSTGRPRRASASVCPPSATIRPRRPPPQWSSSRAGCAPLSPPRPGSSASRIRSASIARLVGRTLAWGLEGTAQ